MRTVGNYGGTLYFPIAEPTNLDPAAVAWYDVHGPIVGQIFEGLTQLDDELEPVPAIARSWESSDAQTWTFHLRAGVRFHNGRVLTPEDVEYSFARVAADSNMWYDATVAPLIDTVIVVDTDTLRITLNQPFAPFPSLLALPFMSVVPSETVGTIHNNPVGSGPFQFQSWTAGDSIVLTAYEDYYGGRPYLDGITFPFYNTEAEMYEDYLRGALEFSPVPDDRVGEVSGNPDAIFVTRLALHYYGMKVDQPPFDDVRVRQALNYAVDRQDIVENVAAGYNVLPEGPIPPGMQGYDPPVPFYCYDPTQALALLAQAGWTDTDFDGVLDDGAGTDLAVELWYNTSPNHEAIAEALADDLRDIGGTGVGATVVVKVRNDGRYDETDVQVRCRISQGGTEVYEETWTISLLGRAMVLDYGTGPQWMLYEPLAYSIECTTLLPGDEDLTNDQKTRDFTVTEDAFYDAYIRDNEYDIGIVCTDRSWQSPDIWVRHQPDGIPRHQHAILGQTNYVYVRGHNKGNTPLTDGRVEVYYHDPSAGIRCGDWVPLSGSVPIFYRYDEFTVWTAWVPDREGHTCLFARFSAPGDPVSAECDVACDNNLAQRNVEVVTLEAAVATQRLQAETGQTSVVFEVSNIYDLPARVDLVVERGTFPSPGTLELEFSRDLFSRWLDAGGVVEGGVVVPDTTRISVTHLISTTVLSLPLSVRETQQARIYLAGPVGAEFELHVSERIHGQVIGGITYHTPIPWTIYLPLVLKGFTP